MIIINLLILIIFVYDLIQNRYSHKKMATKYIIGLHYLINIIFILIIQNMILFKQYMVFLFIVYVCINIYLKQKFKLSNIALTVWWMMYAIIVNYYLFIYL